MIKNLILLCLCTLSLSVSAQNTRETADNTNTWLALFGTHKWSPKWGLQYDVQLRRSDIVREAQQILIRGGINYYFSEQAFLTAGYCFVETWPYGALPAKSDFPENRLWEQIQFKNQTNRAEWVHRFRLEQRWVNAPTLLRDGSYKAGDAIFSNRVRWLTRISLPFKGQTILDKDLYVTAYNELMVSFGKNVKLNVFDQNRAFAGLGYKIPKLGRVEFGYLNHLILKSDGINMEQNHTILAALLMAIDFK